MTTSNNEAARPRHRHSTARSTNTDVTIHNVPNLSMTRHKDYPTKIKDNLICRNQIISQMSYNPEFAEMVKERCRRDIEFWIDVFCWTHDPRKKPANRPFILYTFQRSVLKELVYSIEKPKDLVIEKSRDMGMTWLVLLTIQWYWLFGGAGNDFLFGSRVAAMIDKRGALDSLFEKLRYNLYRQPPSFLPKDFDRERHDSNMKFINPETTSFIRGESNKYFATSGRYKAILLDEFSKWDDDESCYNSSADSAPCRIFVSSANGKNNTFYQLRAQQLGAIRVLTILWNLHPEKNTRWYNREKKRRGKLYMAQEVDINYNVASVGNLAAENFDRNNHVAVYNMYSRHLPLELNCDFNVNPMYWCVSQTSKGHRNTIYEISEPTTITENMIQAFVKRFVNHVERTVILYGDASGHYHSTKSKLTDWEIIENTLRKDGWRVLNKVPARNPSHSERMNVVNKRLKDWEANDRSWETISKECPVLIESLESTIRDESKIIKNGTEHAFDSWSYGLCVEYPIESKTTIYQIKRR